MGRRGRDHRGVVPGQGVRGDRPVDVHRIDVAVFDTIKKVVSPDFESFNGENYVGTLANNGVGLAPVAEGAVSDEVLQAVEDVKMDVIREELDTGWSGYLESLSE